MKQTTLLDLDRTAADAAAPLVGKDQLTILKAQLAAWEIAGHDARDFAAWQQSFTQHLQSDARLAAQLALSAQEDANAAAVAAVAARAAQAAAVPGSTGAAPVPAATPAAGPSGATAGAAPTTPAVKAGIRALVILTAIFSLFFAAPAAKAQIFGSPMVVTGLVSAPILTGFQQTSNLCPMSVSSHWLQLTNITTNFLYTFNYGAQQLGVSGSNFVVGASLTTNFSAANGWTNGATFTWQIPSAYITPAFIPWASALCNTNPTGILFQ